MLERRKPLRAQDETEYVCAKCGGEDIVVTFTAYGSGRAEIAVDNKGRAYVDHVYDKDYDDFEHEQFSCGDCKARWYPLEKGLAPAHVAGIDVKPGDLVILPDGFKAVVATVDTEENTFTVRNWHETFKAGEATLLKPQAEGIAA